ncbi:MAG: transposase [Desulfotomaculum sp.]|nr:transposase [Desulfotomaculum sp.]
MILALNLTHENPLLQLFQKIDTLLKEYEKEIPKTTIRRRRSQLFSDVQIMKCLVYQAFHRIVSFWELEWRLNFDPIAKALIGLEKTPDHTTLFLRAKQLESTIYESLYKIAVEFLHPDIRLCFWDSTSLRASRYDREAKRGKGTRLGWYVGYKLHAIISKDRIPLAWDVTTAMFMTTRWSTYLTK